MSKGKSTLKSFSFGSYMGVDELPDDVASLFSDLVPELDSMGNGDSKVKVSEYAYDIIVAGLDGRIRLNEDFNLFGYEYRIKEKEKMNEEKKRFKNKNKELFIDFGSSDSETEAVLRNGGVTIDMASSQAVEKLADAYEQVIDNQELLYAIDTIKSLNSEFIVDYNIDIIMLMKKAVLGIPHAIGKLRELCSDFEVVSEQVETILSSGYDIESCFA